MVARMPFNLGIGGAVQTGFVYARENGYDYMAQVDGDGQHEPCGARATGRRAASDAEVDMVCGSRFVSRRRPATRRRSAVGPAFICSRSCSRKILAPADHRSDVGFRLYNRRAIGLFAVDYPHDYPEVEAVLMLHAHRLRMSEVAVQMRQRGTGRSLDHDDALCLLHDQGVAGAAGRADAPPTRSSSPGDRLPSRRRRTI